MLKRYAKKLSEELNEVSKSREMFAKKVTKIIRDFEFSKNYLILFGLPKYIPTCQMQVMKIVCLFKQIYFIHFHLFSM